MIEFLLKKGHLKPKMRGGIKLTRRGKRLRQGKRAVSRRGQRKGKRAVSRLRRGQRKGAVSRLRRGKRKGAVSRLRRGQRKRSRQQRTKKNTTTRKKRCRT